MLAVLETYILAAIGELPRDKHKKIVVVVQRVFGGDHDWMKTIRERLTLDASLDEELRSIWSRSRKAARETGTELQPLQFAKMVVNENFAALVDPPSD